MKKVILLVVFSVISVGCGSVTQPVADIPLVDNESLFTPVHFAAKQNKTNETFEVSQLNASSITINHVIYTVGKAFFSASGKDCKFLSSTTNRLLFCYDNVSSGWQQIENVVVEINVNEQGY